MERNWLIRTTQKQILGPVAKSKVLEFLQKGALSLNDEVASGNGYWFALKETDLVEKFLYGDLPQGYNPISESKSVLSKREHPDKTTSLNASPNYKAQTSKTTPPGPGVLPENSDLEYPDVTAIHKKVIQETEEAKLPVSQDLEFPDITLIKANINNSLKSEIKHQEKITTKITSKPGDQSGANLEPIIYPDNDDLAYPDIETEKIVVKTEIKKSTSKDFNNEIEEDSGLSLNEPTPEEKTELTQILKKPKNKESHPIGEEKKLLHERKIKGPIQAAAPKEMKKEPVTEKPRAPMPEHLKKRNDNYLLYMLVILVLIILALFFYYYNTILNKPLPV